MILIRQDRPKQAPSDGIVRGGFCVCGAKEAESSQMDASQTREYCLANYVRHRAARLGPSFAKAANSG